VAVIAGKGFAHFNPIELTGGVREVFRLRTYLYAGENGVDPQDREARVREFFDKAAAAAMGPDVPRAAVQPVVDYFVGKILSAIADGEPSTTE
jgi:hypothetical protein